MCLCSALHKSEHLAIWLRIRLSRIMAIVELVQGTQRKTWKARWRSTLVSQLWWSETLTTKSQFVLSSCQALHVFPSSLVATQARRQKQAMTRKYEVSCLCAEQSYDEQIILEAVQRSFKGEAACVAMRLGTRTSLTELLAKFDSIYGPSKSKKWSLQCFTVFFSYASRGLRKSERNYPAHKLEFLALKWAITEKFSNYLYGHTFTVYTTTINSLTCYQQQDLTPRGIAGCLH